jgi:hypothetical protein
MNDLPGALAAGVQPVHNLTAAIEHEVLTRCRTLESCGIPKSASDGRGNGVDGSNDIGADCQDYQSERE